MPPRERSVEQLTERVRVMIVSFLGAVLRLGFRSYYKPDKVAENNWPDLGGTFFNYLRTCFCQ